MMELINNTTAEIIKASAMRRQGSVLVMHLNNYCQTFVLA